MNVLVWKSNIRFKTGWEANNSKLTLGVFRQTLIIKARDFGLLLL